ncbi:TonB-dependent receptor [Novosphingobium endophyticum]|uniref:TonB-dependent receptor n=1 Tax=Novosphingobium endophyticum TaxID=1955250 RepID=A0A916TRP2_9SPHN|nr:TonB-dependent receptor [Novosphingobium endophyticum]GGB87744.1 TonB-dependent receptor [Novosphingobium endophyticum]
MRSLLLVTLVTSTSLPVVAAAATAAEVGGETGAGSVIADDEDDDLDVDVNEIMVIAPRIRGQVDVPNQPIQTFDEDDIAAYGADSIADLIAAISPQTGSGRGRGDGRPVMLVNGQRITSYREMRRIPPEAIRRMEVLPEEVALRFGYPANQRVVNVILKDRFAAAQAAGEYNRPTRGGYDNYELEAGLFSVEGPRRYNFSAKLTETSMLTENERGIEQGDPVAGEPDPARFRSLAAKESELEIDGTMTQGLGEGGLAGSLTVNGAYTHTQTNSLSGLNTVTLTPDGDSKPDPLRNRQVADTFEVGLGYNTMLGDWTLSATGDGSYTDTNTRVDRRDAGGVDVAINRDLSLETLTTLSGTPFRMPAGDASLTVNAGFDFDRTSSEDTRTALDTVTLKRGDVSGGANLALPLTRRGDLLGAIGELALNLGGGVNHLSDFGSLTNWNAGLTWNPTDTLSFQASYLVEDAAPALSRLGAPTIPTFNVPVYDFATGTTALVTVTTGGNPDLLKEKQRDIKLSASWDLPFLRRSNLIVEYFRNRSSDVTASFPLLTPAIEAAFPGRVTRNAAGQLIAIDRRPITYDEISSSSMRWGFNLSGSLGSDEEARPPARREGAPAPGGGQGGARGEGQGARQGASGAAGSPPPVRGFGRGGRGSRWNLSIYHTWRFTDRVRIAENMPVLDALAGDALASGGVPRHSIELEGGVFKNGYGLRLKGEWDGPATVNGSGLPGSSDLRFGSTFVVDARLFIDLGRNENLVAKVPFLKGARLALTADNLLDSRQKVTDENGEVPFAYQAAYREPQGRVVGIDFRKMF